MSHFLGRIFDQLRRLRASEGGVAAVEFALIVPMMLMLYIGSVEISALIGMDRKLQSLTGAIGDLVARSDTKIKSVDLEDYFKAAGGIMTPHPTTGLRQIVTSVKVQNGTTTVAWSRQYLDGAMTAGPYATGANYVLPEAMKNIAANSFVIVAEGRYDYEPLYGFAFKQTINLYRQNFFMPRFGSNGIKLE